MTQPVMKRGMRRLLITMTSAKRRVEIFGRLRRDMFQDMHIHVQYNNTYIVYMCVDLFEVASC